MCITCFHYSWDGFEIFHLVSLGGFFFFFYFLVCFSSCYFIECFDHINILFSDVSFLVCLTMSVSGGSFQQCVDF